MTISLIQMDIAWSDPLQNIEKASLLLERQKADLYVLPEMWSTGYSAHPERIVEKESISDSLRWMREMAYKKHCAISGSIVVRDENGDYRNRHYFVSYDGLFYYDKHHLFSYAHENLFYKSGSDSVIVDYKGFRLLLQTCYDLRFPLWSRYGHAGIYDGIIYVANWPQTRQTAWDTLIRARAIENQCYVIAVNRVGQERNNCYAGGSAVIDPQGNVISACGSVEGTTLAEITLDEVLLSRSAFPVLPDRD